MFDFNRGLKFTTAMQNEKGPPHTTHALITNGYIVATNGIVSAGVQTNSGLTCNPHSDTLKKAIATVDSEKAQFIIMDDTTLLIRAGRRRIKVPCVASAILTPVAPDIPICGITQDFLQGLYAIGDIVSDSAETVLASSVLLTENVAVAATQHMYAEFWHGLNLPQLVVPKQFLTVLSKTKGKAVSLGYSHQSMTVWFDDDAWLRTNLFQKTAYPSVANLSAMAGKERRWCATPLDFEEHLTFIAKFCDHGTVTLNNNVIGPVKGGKSASYDFEDLRGSGRFKISDLITVAKLATHVDFVGDETAIYFASNTVRGLVAKMRD